MSSERFPRIGYLVQQFPPEVGAGPARVTEMALRWVAAGASVTVITGMPNRPAGRIHPDYRGKLFVEDEWQGIRVLRSWLYASPRPGFARTLLNNASFMVTSALHGLFRGGAFDVLIASSPPFFPHISGVALAALRRTPLVLEIRDLWPDYLVGMGVVRNKLAARALFGLERALLRRAERTVVVTESFRRRVVGKGVPEDHIEVIPNGVDARHYYPAAAEPPLEALRREGDEFIVGYLGNFGAGQGLETVIEAAALLADSGERIRFVLAGDGPTRGQIEACARELGVRNITIHPPIAKEATRAFYNSCDLCLVPLAPFPILQETVPSKIFEVMACERPVLASLGGEGARIMEESGAGVVIPPGEPGIMAEAIGRLAAMPGEELRELGRRGSGYVARHYGRDLLAERYLALLTEVAQSSARRRKG